MLSILGISNLLNLILPTQTEMKWTLISQLCGPIDYSEQAAGLGLGDNPYWLCPMSDLVPCHDANSRSIVFVFGMSHLAPQILTFCSIMSTAACLWLMTWLSRPYFAYIVRRHCAATRCGSSKSRSVKLQMQDLLPKSDTSTGDNE